MENKIIIGNMKMNLTYDMIKEYAIKMSKYKNFILCPSSIYLSFFINEGYTVGLQNISEYGMGSSTGEISVNQAISMGIKYVIIGHSDRRQYFHETDDVINRKLRKAVSNNLTSILCIGENLSEKKAGVTKEVLRKQIIEDLDHIDREYYKNIIIAYEPVWAIGTGKVPSNKEIEEMVLFIKQTISDKYNFIPNVLYGGSTNEKNIEELNKINVVNGFLVGGACLIPDKIIKIIETVN